MTEMPSLNSKFKDLGYIIVKNALGTQSCMLCANYFSFLDAYHKDQVVWDPNQQSAGRYIDPLGESLLFQIQPIVEQHTGLSLIPTYSYLRIYKENAALKRHTDRPAGEIAVTLFLGSDNLDNDWPIYVDINGEERAIHLDVGDMMIYRGCEVPHWRNEFKGKASVHAFLCYVDAQGLHTEQAYDGRQGLGAPQTRSSPADLKNKELQQQLWQRAVEAEKGNT